MVHSRRPLEDLFCFFCVYHEDLMTGRGQEVSGLSAHAEMLDSEGSVRRSGSGRVGGSPAQRPEPNTFRSSMAVCLLVKPASSIHTQTQEGKVKHVQLINLFSKCKSLCERLSINTTDLFFFCTFFSI